MKNIRTKNRSITFILFLLIAIQFSCKKFTEVEVAPNLIQTPQLFISDVTALSAVNGVYYQMRAVAPSIFNGSISIYGGLCADEFTTNLTSQEYDAFYRNSILSTSSIINSQLWTAAYRIIYRTNAIIENLQKSNGVSTLTKNQLLGEMKTVRGVAYFFLVNLFGDVPLILNIDYLSNERAPRTSSDMVYNQITEDLKDATNLLSNTYPSNLRARPNKFTAASLLAKVYLFKKDWQNAELYSSSVINSGNYSLLNNLNDVFKNNSTETIWQIAPGNESRNTIEGSNFIPPSSTSVPSIVISSTLNSVFENGDRRKANWLGLNTNNGNQYFYPFKYKRRVTTPVDEYIVVSRLAEQYLIRSEARVRQNKIAEALQDLNMIRNRAGLPNSNANDPSSLISAIIQERRVELFAEWGNRWFDLKRLELANSILGPIKGANWQNTDMLFPIPFSETEINNLLIQNPGY